ncbi:MAG: phosphoribosylformylglycinamidine synthase subunit PurL [Candidatus Cloacimonetes bacterium]|nr:phosphoribosylformylglycinamidine synthase subunit PurL [Candidatus Cloacimonadota bacterium]
MTEPKLTPELIAEHGISDDEYKQILSILGRIPTWVELGIFSVMWSEHASYKNSILQLKTLPKDGDNMLAKAGEENAGVVDIGDGKAICFKIESHNHPSAVEPYHGAATGVGGILRDIFTMGAKPIAALNSLRFGNPDAPQIRHLIEGVVDGIADYGNCFGVPTVGGEIYFEECYEGNPLVNAMAVGILDHSTLAKSAAQGVGNAVIYVGSKTGRDGIHGATFASIELTEESEEKRTAVQVGDPFLEKLLLEATLEVIHKKMVVAIQDMGAAGLTCSSSEMAGKGNVGIDIDVSLVPQREKGMSAYEIMLSESQERMLLIIKPEDFPAVQEVFHKWDLDAIQIGKVTDDQMLRIREQGRIVAEIPAVSLILGGSAPVYKRETRRPARLDKCRDFTQAPLPEPACCNDVLRKLMASPNIASKRYFYRQYDHMVQIGTTVEPGSDAAVIRIKDTNKAIALATDCNGRYCFLDPYEGAKAAVVESARNVACSGGKPVAITNCLNFGNPYKPEVYFTFTEVIRGMKDACLALGTPVTGGNVSFYNENPSDAIYPTPVIGMLGVLEDFHKATTQYFKHPGDLIILLGEHASEIGASEYLKCIHGLIDGRVPKVDLAKEKLLQESVLALIGKGLIMSAHDCSDGGLAICLAESCFNPEGLLGAYVSFELAHSKSIEYFGESQARILISIRKTDIEPVSQYLYSRQQPFLLLGEVTDKTVLKVNRDIDCPVQELYKTWSERFTIQ